MTKPLIYGAAALVALGAGATGAWFWGAGRVGAAVDAQAQTLAAQGLRLTWAERSVSGFPFAYVVRLEDVTLADPAAGWSLTLPWTETAAPLLGGQVLRTTTAPTGALTGPDLGGSATFALALDGLTLDTPLVGAASARIAADAIGLTATPTAELREARLRLGAVAGTLESFVGGGGKLDLRAGEMTAAFDVGGGGRTAVVASDVAATATTDGGPRIDLDRLAAGEGSASVELRVGALRSEGAEGVASTGVASGRFGIVDGRLTYLADAQDVRIGVMLGRAGRGSARMARATAGLDVPVRPAPTPQAYTLQLGLDAVELEDALWVALDPAGRLPRDPMGLAVDVGGRARVTGAVSPGELSAAGVAGTPVQVETVEITRAALHGLGARVAAQGALTIVPGSPTPDGRIDLRAEGWAPVLETAVALGVVSSADAATLLATAARLGRADAGEGVFESRIELRDGQIWANGERVR